MFLSIVTGISSSCKFKAFICKMVLSKTENVGHMKVTSNNYQETHGWRLRQTGMVRSKTAFKDILMWFHSLGSKNTVFQISGMTFFRKEPLLRVFLFFFRQETDASISRLKTVWTNWMGRGDNLLGSEIRRILKHFGKIQDLKLITDSLLSGRCWEWNRYK